MSDAAPNGQPPRLAFQAFWLLVARTTAFTMTLVLPILLTRLFTENQFGTYRLALVAATTASNILSFNVGMSAFYYLPRLSDIGRRQLIFNIIAYHAMLGALVVGSTLLWPNMLTALPGTAALAPLTPVVGLMIAFVLFAGFFETIATANQDVWYSTAFIVTAQLTRALMIIGAAFYYRTVSAVLWAWTIQAMFQSAFLLWYLHHRFPYFWRYRSGHMAAEQIQYVWPLGITTVLTVLQLDIHNYIVSYSFSTATYAVYAIGTSQVPLIGILRDSIQAVMQGRMSQLQQNDDKTAMLHLLLRTWRILAAACIPAFVGLMLLADDFITALYTASYKASVPVFRLNLTLIIVTMFVTDAVVRAFADQRVWVLRNRATILAIQLMLSAALLRYMGLMGVLAALVISWIIERMLNIRLVFRTLGFSRQHRYIFRQLGHITVVAAAAGVITYGLLAAFRDATPLVRLLTGVAVYAITYLSLMLTTGFLDPDEKELLVGWGTRWQRMVKMRLSPGT